MKQPLSFLILLYVFSPPSQYDTLNQKHSIETDPRKHWSEVFSCLEAGVKSELHWRTLGRRITPEKPKNISDY